MYYLIKDKLEETNKKGLALSDSPYIITFSSKQWQSEKKNYPVSQNIEEETDILICICNKKGTQIPGKIYHYAATNKPILIILDGEKKEELKTYFEKFKRYNICQNTEESIMENINKIIKEKNKCEPLKELNAKNIAKAFLDYNQIKEKRENNVWKFG